MKPIPLYTIHSPIHRVVAVVQMHPHIVDAERTCHSAFEHKYKRYVYLYCLYAQTLRTEIGFVVVFVKINIKLNSVAYIVKRCHEEDRK